MGEPSHLFDGVFAPRQRHPRHGIAITPVPLQFLGGAFLEDTSWASFDMAAESLAAELHEAGISRGDRIGWIGPNDPMQILLLAACSRLGAIQVPLNWRLSTEELRWIEDDAGLGMLAVPESTRREARFAHPYVEDFRARHGGRAMAVGDPLDWHDVLYEDGRFAAMLDRLPPPPSPDAPLLLCYTSGTTGRPKGAVLTQGAMEAHARIAQALFGITPLDTVMTVLPMFHVGGLCIQTLPALLAGADVVLHARFDPGAFFDSIERDKPTLTLLVPVVMRALVEHQRWPGADLSCLRAIGAGSSEVPLDLIAAFHAKGVPVQNIYGATETGPIAIAQSIEDSRAAPGSIGRPMPGVAARLAPDTGEIQLRGSSLMRGYWQRDDAFLRDGWFATGDVGRLDPEGRFWFTGRLSQIIISGGENIHPAELERVLATAPGILDCAVVGRADPRWGEVPVAIVVPGEGFDAAAVLAHCEGRIARFKQPRDVITVPALPRTALGKVAVAALKALVAAR